MNARRKSFSLSAFVLIAASFVIAGPAQAQRKSAPQNHDGIYSVHIVTERGSCEKSYVWTIAISGGRVSSTGNTPMEAIGEISRQGVVSFEFRGFNEVALVAGRLKGRQGSGTWNSPTLACAGVWRAMRQS
jgi:hypothetical protein